MEYGQAIGVIVLFVVVGIQIFIIPWYRNRHKNRGGDAGTKE